MKDFIDKYVWYQEGPGVRKHQYTNKGVKLLNVANLIDGVLDLSTSSRYISEEEAYGKYKHFLVDEGDLIIASSGIKVEYFDRKMGFVNKNQMPLCMNTSTIRFKTKDKNITNIRYFMYFLKSDDFKNQLSKLITGSAQLNFGPSHLKKVRINLPSIAKQKEAVERLDRIQEIIYIRKKQIENLNLLTKSQFVEMFGRVELNDKNFDEQEINHIADITSSKRIYANEYQENGVPFYRSKEIIELGHNKKPSIELFISAKRYEEIKDRYGIPKRGDILITAVGTIGETWIVDNDEPFYYKDGNVLQIRLNADISQIYFKYVLDILISSFKNKNVSGSAYSALTIEKFKKMKIILPPIELQNQFADFVEQVDKKKFELEKSLEEMQNLFDSLMAECFG